MNRSTLCVGADVHLDEIVLCAVDKAESHEVCKRFHVTSNLPGAQAAARAIAAIAESLDYDRIEIGWEATGLLWIPFYRYPRDCAQLQPFEPKLVCFNPQLVSKFKDGHGCARCRCQSLWSQIHQSLETPSDNVNIALQRMSRDDTPSNTSTSPASATHGA